MNALAQPHIAFRTDASLQIGTGHVMRCLTLADALRARGAQSTFICRPHTGHLLNMIRQRGHTATALAAADDGFTAPSFPAHAQWLGTDWAKDAEQTRQALGGQVADWLVVDHYALAHQWEQALRPHSRRIMAIDDLADRPHDCDLLLDQNLGRQAQDYAGLLSGKTLTLTGPAYALLRPEFAQWREHSLQNRNEPQRKNLLISMGGADQHNATGTVLDAIKSSNLPSDLRITVVMGPTAPWLAQVQAQAAAMPQSTQVLDGVSNMAQLMAESDLCIGAAGSSAWERCAMGLPTVVWIMAANQQKGALALQAHGAAVIAADSSQLTHHLTTLLVDDQTSLSLRKMSHQASILTASDGTAQVVELLLASHD
ncbi:UDP-2,4-diacetamido-2,4,6-trideoxy-beta-L-altropyranose hydrolase [Limnohabitans sp.]|jgi:UDP-2,4-diacetamido-2,4,6-trideoxy-beta-L-altropyranose hydrolase|uniref:UDP-2,4-diacetamido-2,4, 6-trideoxy-beta-L-altropyranose hydrolase n=1 Tax=Limnohabitans sp. TaxID=1907725 RepID=UPI0037BF8257